MTHPFVDDEDIRPDVDQDGNAMAQGDLIEIVSRGVIFHAYVDDDSAEQAVPARQKDVDNVQWFNSLDWDTARLLKKVDRN